MKSKYFPKKLFLDSEDSVKISYIYPKKVFPQKRKYGYVYSLGIEE